jgi:glycosyltransferase involved in cell wall biosynthesis
VIAASEFLAAQARALGARRVEIVPPPLVVPEATGTPEEPPHVLYAGRLSEEKGILDFVAATDGLPRVVVGDGPLRGRVPDAVGPVSPEAMGTYYDHAAVVCVPSRREGYGMTAREALAHGRPLVATRVGGLAELEDAALLVEPRDTAGLRAAIERLLADAGERTRLGAAARDFALARFGPDAAGAALLEAYRKALEPG